MSQTPLPIDGQTRELAKRIARAGLRPIAPFLLEPGRPLALLAAQLVWLAQPVLALAWQPAEVARWARYLERPGSINALIELIDAEE